MAAAVLEALPHAVGVIGPDAHLVYANARLRDLWKLPETPPPDPLPLKPGRIQHGGAVFQLGFTELVGGLLLVTVEPLTDAQVKFLSVAAHDLRGAMANVRSSASLLLSPKLGLEDRAKRCAEVIARNTDKALAMARDVFDSLRHELSAMPVELEPIDPGPLLQTAYNNARATTVQQQISVELSVSTPEGLPLIQADGERFGHAVQGLLEHSAMRGAGGKVRLQATPLPGRLLIEVGDDGPLPTPEERPTLFDRNQRVVAEHKLGVGFKLCFAREELEAIGASLEVGPDHDGIGTLWSFSLPVASS
jgi:two-component system OmpR family sensor kinase